MGHAGSDVEAAYRTPAALTADARRDPLLRTARLLVRSGTLSPDEVLERYEDKRTEVRAIAEEISYLPRLRSAAEVMTPLALPDPEAIAADVAAGAGPPSGEGAPLTLAQAINRSLSDALTRYPQTIVFGQDVAAKGGVYGVTRGLVKQAGAARVFDTLLDEQTILGLALGAGVSGLVPIPEIQYLAYLHNAIDQLRGEAASLKFFSAGQYRNPMVVRVAGYGYQKGFGGHFHNDNGIASLRDIPGLILASPSRPDDATSMMRTCLSATLTHGTPCVFLEPIALYHTRDLHEDGDEAWLASYPGTDHHAPIGRARTYGTGDDLTIVTFANGVYMSLRVAARLQRKNIQCRVVDLRWLAPLPKEDVLAAAQATQRVLLVDETRRTGGVSEALFTLLIDAGFSGAMARVASEDSFVPLGNVAREVFLSEQTIEETAEALVTTPTPAVRHPAGIA
jgi:2-oxoisovalerate dehydrogenase E1 component